MSANIAIPLGVVMILLFMYLKQKPKKEGTGFFAYIFNLLTMTFLFFMGGGFLILGISDSIAEMSDNIGVEKATTTVMKDTEIETEEFKNPIDEAISKGRKLAEKRIAERSLNMWKTYEETSQIDDTITITTTARAIQQINKQFGYATPTVVFTCNKRKLEAYINWDMFIGLESKRVSVRIDKNVASSSLWTASTDGKATYANSPKSFARSLLNKQKLTVQVTPFNRAPVTTVFDISDFNNGISQLREKCSF